jgi:hypothetical protein
MKTCTRIGTATWPKVERHLSESSDSDMVELDIFSLGNEGYKWVKYTPETNLNDLEKLHSGESSDSYILHSIADPKVLDSTWG